MKILKIPGIEKYKDSWGLSLRMLVMRFHHSPELVLHYTKKYNISLRNSTYPSKILNEVELKEVYASRKNTIYTLKEKYGVSNYRMSDILTDFAGYQPKVKSTITEDEIADVIEHGVLATNRSTHSIKKAMERNGVSFIDDLEIDAWYINNERAKFIENSKDIFQIWEIAAFTKIKFELLTEYYDLKGYKYRIPGIFDYDNSIKKKAIAEFKAGATKTNIAIRYGINANVLHRLLKGVNSSLEVR